MSSYSILSRRCLMRIAALLVCAASLALAVSPARDVTFLSTSDSHYREPDHKAGCHNDLNRATVEEMNRLAAENNCHESCGCTQNT